MNATIQLNTQPLDRHAAANAISFAPLTVSWFRLAAIYLVASVGLGMAMGASGDFTLRSVHSHLGLLGWTTLALAGLIYRDFPEAGACWLARVHFWLLDLALPPMMGSLAALLLGYPGAAPVLAGSQIVLAAGLLAFVVNVFLNVTLKSAARGPGVAHGGETAAQQADLVQARAS